MLAAAFLTTWLTVFSEMPCPQILPARQTHRNSGPPSITAAVNHASLASFTQLGTGTVRVCLPLPFVNTVRLIGTECDAACKIRAIGENMPLRRYQLFELEDLTWFPQTIRDLATDYLHFMETHFHLHEPIVPILRATLTDAGTTSVIDLCSGGGGPVLALYEALHSDVQGLLFTLTDRYPNTAAFAYLSAQCPAGIHYVAHPVDATEVPKDLLGMRTMFNAYHHFAPTAARRVLENAVEAQQPVGIFEIPERDLLRMLPFLFTPIFVAAATPFIKPFSWQRLLWTYLVPLVPLTCWWDGLVSACRAYTVAEMQGMTAGLEGYHWKADRVGVYDRAGHLTYLVGIPRPQRGRAL
jgi:hypothetical protein